MHKRTYIKHYMKIFSYEYIGLYKNIKYICKHKYLQKSHNQTERIAFKY